MPSYLGIGIFILALALVSYLVRIIVPLGKPVSLFVYFLSFPTIAYLPQYLSFFVLGTVAGRHNWFQTLPNSMGRAGFVTAAVAAVALFPIVFISLLIWMQAASPQLPPFGYGTWQSAVYALWDSAFAVGMVLGLIPLFRRFFNEQGRFGRFLSQNSYTVYIIHVPIIVLLAVALRGIGLQTYVKFAIMAVIVVPVCFAAAYLVRGIPLAARVL